MSCLSSWAACPAFEDSSARWVSTSRSLWAASQRLDGDLDAGEVPGEALRHDVCDPLRDLTELGLHLRLDGSPLAPDGGDGHCVLRGSVQRVLHIQDDIRFAQHQKPTEEEQCD